MEDIHFALEFFLLLATLILTEKVEMEVSHDKVADFKHVFVDFLV